MQKLFEQSLLMKIYLFWQIIVTTCSKIKDISYSSNLKLFKTSRIYQFDKKNVICCLTVLFKLFFHSQNIAWDSVEFWRKEKRNYKTAIIMILRMLKKETLSNLIYKQKVPKIKKRKIENTSFGLQEVGWVSSQNNLSFFCCFFFLFWNLFSTILMMITMVWKGDWYLLPHSPCNPRRDRNKGISLLSDDTHLTPCGRKSV